MLSFDITINVVTCFYNVIETLPLHINGILAHKSNLNQPQCNELIIIVQTWQKTSLDSSIYVTLVQSFHGFAIFTRINSECGG